MTYTNQALADEAEAVSSIYDADTLQIVETNATISTTSAILTLPDIPISFSLSFSSDYPDVPPQIIGTHATGASTRKGEGEAAVTVLRDILGTIFVPGQVCLFDLIEESLPLLKGSDSDSPSLVTHHQQDSQSTNTGAVGHGDGTLENFSESSTIRSASSVSDSPCTSKSTSISTPAHTFGSSSIVPNSLLAQSYHTDDLTSSLRAVSIKSSSLAPPNWILSDPLVVNKSTFVGRALAVSSLEQATDSINHLLATNKRVAGATHNITAWRIKQSRHQNDESLPTSPSQPEIIIQDCDDDGETAAGGRLLQLMQLTDVWNVVVVVTRWYGGVKLGADRFRCINNVGREALVKGGFVKEKEKDGRSKSSNAGGGGGGDGGGGKARSKKR